MKKQLDKVDSTTALNLWMSDGFQQRCVQGRCLSTPRRRRVSAAYHLSIPCDCHRVPATRLTSWPNRSFSAPPTIRCTPTWNPPALRTSSVRIKRAILTTWASFLPRKAERALSGRKVKVTVRTLTQGGSANANQSRSIKEIRPAIVD